MKSKRRWPAWTKAPAPGDGGPAPKPNIGASDSNRLRVIAVGASGYFFINDAFVDTLGLSKRLDAGDVASEVAAANKVDGRSTRVENFSVASLD